MDPCLSRTILNLTILLIFQVDNARRDELFTVTLSWCGDQKVVHRQLGLQLIGLFVEVESTKFDGRLQNAIPIVVDNMEPSKYTSVNVVDLSRKFSPAVYSVKTSADFTLICITLAPIKAQCFQFLLWFCSWESLLGHLMGSLEG